MTKELYTVYKGRITTQNLSTSKILYSGFDKEKAEEIYCKFKEDNLVFFEKEQFIIQKLNL